MKVNLFFILCFLCLNTYAQKATIYFSSQDTCEVCLYESLDNGFNDEIQTRTLTVFPDKSLELVEECPSDITIYLKIPKYKRNCYIVLIPNDTVYVNIHPEGTTYEGRNKAGLQYYNDHYARPLISELRNVNNVSKGYIAGETEYEELMKLYRDTLGLDAHCDIIRKLDMDEELRSILLRETKLINELLIYSSLNTITSKEARNQFASLYKMKNDTTNYVYMEQLKQAKNEIYLNNGLYPADIRHRFSSGYVGVYLRHHTTEKGGLLGAYSHYLNAPMEMQPALLGNAARTQLEYHTEKMDMKRWLEYFETNFPESDYLRIIKKQLQEKEANEKNVENILFVEQGITALSQLKDVPDLKGKYLFVDLWATWCNPCRAELAKAAELHQLLSSYNNVLPVYISIDGDKQDKAWRDMTAYYHLEGYHLRASSQLQASIKEQLYGSENISVPRYVLIAPDGSIAHGDLPRPSNRIQLKETLDGILLNK